MTLSCIVYLIPTHRTLLATDQIQSCIADIRFWITKNKLAINDEKTEFLIIISKRSKFSADIRLHISEESIPPFVACQSLGWWSISNGDTKQAYLPYSSLPSTQRYSWSVNKAKLLHSLVTSLLDYCNSLLHGVQDSSAGAKHCCKDSDANDT